MQPQARRTALLGLTSDELRALAQSENQPAYRGSQLSEWLYRRGARTFSEMVNLPRALHTRLEEKYEVGRSQIVAVRRSRDGTFKLLLQLHDGERVETVGLPYEDRFSCCVSAQVGCPIGCVFCATGLSGYIRNLTAGEIMDQALSVEEIARSSLPQPDSGQSRIVDHVTFMGMGEPLLNYEATLKAVRLLNKEAGIAARHITVSTAGLVPGINRLAGEKLQITLALSLHAPDDELRRRIVPGMARWSVAEVLEACRDYVQQTGRRLTIEYCLIGGVNDSAAQAHRLVELLQRLNCQVNLIPHNPIPDTPYRAPSTRHVRAFYRILDSAGIPVTQRVQRGPDIGAACGQLRRRAGTRLNR